jgi:hypothetical protein
MDAEEMLAAKRDDFLRKKNEVNDLLRKAKREVDHLEDERDKCNAEARRLQLAIFALEGKEFSPTTAGETNSAISQRERELRSVQNG